MKPQDFIKEGYIADDADAMHKDHEVQMARQDCYNSAKNAIELHNLLKNISEMQGLEGWVSEKLALAADYLKTVKEYLEYDMMAKTESMPSFNMESAEKQFEDLVKEDASAGACSAGAVATVVKPLGGKPGTGKPKKVGNMIKRPKVTVGKGVY
jgi:hypothetical protein